MFKKILITLLCSTFACQSFARPPQPARCPSASSIKSAGLSNVEYYEDENTYAAFQVSQYDTDTIWGFAVGKIKASSQQEALQIGTEELAGLAGSPAPVFDKYDNLWICFYATTSGDSAVAITPYKALSQVKMKKFLNYH